jgi:ribosomal protein L11 methylase PrmA
MLTYKKYLEEKDRLTFQEAEEIHSQILQYAMNRDSDFQEYWEEMIRSAIFYANTRAQWSVQTLEERRNIDNSRTHQHNDFMINLKVIATYMKQQDWSTEWFDKLGTIEKDRKRFGDFACYLVYINSLNAR